MNKTLKALIASTALAMAANSAFATNRQEETPSAPGYNVMGQTQTNNQTQNNNQRQGQGQRQTATGGNAVSGAVSTSGAVSGSTSGANANNANTVNASSTNAISTTGGSSHVSVGGPEITSGNSTSNSTGNNSHISIGGAEISNGGVTGTNTNNNTANGGAGGTATASGGTTNGTVNATVNPTINSSPTANGTVTSTVSPTQNTTLTPTQTATTGSQNATTGSQVTKITSVSQDRTFIAPNAPHVAAALSGCMAVSGWSLGFSLMGTDAGALTLGKNDPQFVEQCALVSSAFQAWQIAREKNNGKGDKQLEAYAIQMLNKALPGAGQAMTEAVEMINKYISKYGAKAPKSVMQVFGAVAFEEEDTAPAADTQPQAVTMPAPAATPVQIDLGITLVQPQPEVKTVTKTIVKKVNPDGTPYVAPKKDCDCAKPAAPAASGPKR